jgi:hypothetical protein
LFQFMEHNKSVAVLLFRTYVINKGDGETKEMNSRPHRIYR